MSMRHPPLRPYAAAKHYAEHYRTPHNIRRGPRFEHFMNGEKCLGPWWHISWKGIPFPKSFSYMTPKQRRSLRRADNAGVYDCPRCHVSFGSGTYGFRDLRKADLQQTGE